MSKFFKTSRILKSLKFNEKTYNELKQELSDSEYVASNYLLEFCLSLKDNEVYNFMKKKDYF